MARSLYGALFDWIILHINHAMFNRRDMEESVPVSLAGRNWNVDYSRLTLVVNWGVEKYFQRFPSMKTVCGFDFNCLLWNCIKKAYSNTTKHHQMQSWKGNLSKKTTEKKNLTMFDVCCRFVCCWWVVRFSCCVFSVCPSASWICLDSRTSGRTALSNCASTSLLRRFSVTSTGTSSSWSKSVFPSFESD